MPLSLFTKLSKLAITTSLALPVEKFIYKSGVSASDITSLTTATSNFSGWVDGEDFYKVSGLNVSTFDITTSLALPVALQVLKSFVLERLSITCSVLTASLKVNVTVVVSPAINSVLILHNMKL
jgi:hypothetical protein